MAGYKDNLEHLLEELRRIELIVYLQVIRFRMKGRGALNEFRDFCIKEEEIDAILAGEDSFDGKQGKEPSRLKTLQDQLASLESKISDKKIESFREGRMMRLERLGKLFRLSTFDLDALLICLAPELDLKYERLYAYLQDNLTKKRPSVDLVLELLCPDFESKLAHRQRFVPTAPLMRHRFLTVSEEIPERTPPLLAYHLNVDDRIVQYLLGSDQIEARLLSFVHQPDFPVTWQDLILVEGIKERLEKLAREYLGASIDTSKPHDRPEDLIFYFQGPAGFGKQTTAGALCRKLGIPLLVIDTARLLHGDLNLETATRLLFREALLQQAALYFDHFDLLLAESDKAISGRKTVMEELERLPGLIFLAGGAAWEPGSLFRHRNFVHVDFPFLSFPLRKELWKSSLNGAAPCGLDVEVLANKFRLSAGQIHNAVAAARNLALWRDPANRRPTSDDLYSACRAQSNRKLSTLAHRTTPKYGWADIVLPNEQMTLLRELLNYVKYRHLVYGEWGFDRKLSLGKGLNILFSGSSGTGKTMAAEILAGELGLDLYKIDLSAVVSKYIGETEKNLSRIFQEAQHSNAVLFFDEADALFGKRSEVKDAHDRYANIEIAYLLQKMDEYDGIVILATNLRNNMDEAFVRRMQGTVDFPFPEEDYRRRIFEGIFPKEAPLGSDIDFAFLARQFKLTGGNIKNIALHAAFLAAEECGAIGMTHLIRATKRELQKMGRLCSKADFGPYYDVMKESAPERREG